MENEIQLEEEFAFMRCDELGVFEVGLKDIIFERYNTLAQLFPSGYDSMYGYIELRTPIYDKILVIRHPKKVIIKHTVLQKMRETNNWIMSNNCFDQDKKTFVIKYDKITKYKPTKF